MKDYIEERAVAIANYIIDPQRDGEADGKEIRDFEVHSTQGYGG